MAASVQGSKRWHEHMTSRITDDVKVVGSTVNCEAAYWENKLDGKARKNPHVQSYAMATDQAQPLLPHYPSALWSLGYFLTGLLDIFTY